LMATSVRHLLFAWDRPTVKVVGVASARFRAPLQL
jgi:hypothetical protein